MWTKAIVCGALLLFLVPDLYAEARCKIDGVWYSYDSPECNPHKPVIPDRQPEAASPASEVLAEQAPVLSVEAGISADPILKDAAFLRPWAEVASTVEQFCLNAPYCRMMEESSYWAMRGSFAMPESVAAEAKVRCDKQTPRFSFQARCMEGESEGYFRFSAELDLPEHVAMNIRTECQEKFESWSQVAACLENGVSRFRNPHGANRTPRRHAVGASGFSIPDEGFAKLSEVATLTVQPLAPIPLPPPGATYPDPVPMKIDQRAARLAEDAADPVVLQEAVKLLESQATFVVLNATAPKSEGLAALSYNYSPIVTTDFGVGFSEKDGSTLGLTLAVEMGRVYLLDYAVRSHTPGSYVLKVGSNEHIYEDMGGAIEHVTARLIPEASGKIEVTLGHVHGRGFRFYALEITSVAATGVFAP